MRVAVLGSGSRGNSILVVAGETRVLVDAGFSARDLESRLGGVGIPPGGIDGIVITHDHGDHTRGVGVYARRHHTPVFLTKATLDACGPLFNGTEDLRPYRVGFPFLVGRLEIQPFLTLHDARDPVAVSLRDTFTGLKLGVATDMGRPTAQVRHALSQCDLLILEANHDPGLLLQSAYPASVKSRIASGRGHLSNEAAARFALDLLHPRLAGVVLAHLSAECNTPDLAEAIVREALGRAGYQGLLWVAEQDRPTPFLDVAQLRRRLDPVQLRLL